MLIEGDHEAQSYKDSPLKVPPSCFETSEMTWLASERCVSASLFVVVERVRLALDWKHARAGSRRHNLKDISIMDYRMGMLMDFYPRDNLNL